MGKRKKISTEVFNPYKVYKYAANHLYDRRKYPGAINLYKTAEENARTVPMKVPLYSKRCDANWHMGNMQEAQTDVDKGLELAPLDFGLRKALADLMFQQNKFEDALGVYNLGNLEKPKPPRFTNGIHASTGTIRTAVGKWAGEIMGDLLLGPIVVQMKLKKLGLMPTPLVHSEIARRRKLKKIEKYKKAYATIYLGDLAIDKHHMMDWQKNKKLYLGNEEHNQWLRTTLEEAVQKLSDKEGALWKRKPLYTRENSGILPPKLKAFLAQKPKLRAQFVEKRIQLLLHVVEKALFERRYADCFKNAEKLREILSDEPECLLHKKSEYMEQCLVLVGEMFLSMKRILTHYSVQINDERILCILGATADVPLKTAHEVYREGFHPPIPGIYKFIRKQMENFNLTEGTLEKAYLSHEIAAAYSLSKQSNLMRTYARKAIGFAKEAGSSIWFINALFLLVRTELEDYNLTDAKVTLTALKSAAERFGYSEAAEFAERGLILLHYEKEKFRGEDDILVKREQDIVDSMYNEDYRITAIKVINRKNQLPLSKRMTVIPGLEPVEVEKQQEEEEEEPAIISPDDEKIRFVDRYLSDLPSEEVLKVDTRKEEDKRQLAFQALRRSTFDFDDPNVSQQNYFSFK